MLKIAKKYDSTKKPTFLTKHEGLKLIKTDMSDPEFCFFYTTHYVKSKGIIGRQFKYKIYKDGIIVGIIGGNSPPLKLNLFRNFFQTDNEKLYLNNNIFRLILHEKNLATKILKIFRNRIFEDYLKDYNIKLLGLVTFVSMELKGTIYFADNWKYLGMTKGIELKKTNSKIKHYKKKGKKKHVFAYKYPERFRKKYEIIKPQNYKQITLI